MNIPPFPAHDLAKLVLGYLAEEQLMTAYDEFLSASPYLDSLRNEYDRIFMTSLKNILAEYRAVKIYVESCKPYLLRRKLFGCTNLLEIVKFLVQNVDINKIHVPEVVKPSVDGRNSCAVCVSLKLPHCECKGRHSLSASNQSAQRSSLETSVEATPLEDLPGNHVKNTNRKKLVKTLSKDSRVSQSALSSDSNLSVNVGSNFTPSFDHTLPNNSQTLQARICNSALNSANLSKSNVQNVGHIQKHATYQGSNMNCTENVTTQRVSLPRTFQDFTSGVEGAENINSNVPDSSTSENVSLYSSSSKEICLPGPTNSMKPVSKAHIFLTVGTIKTSTTPQAITLPGHSPALSSRHNPKTNEKVTILSDIKVDKTFNTDSVMPAILKNATSTPLMHMQTILINGTPVYQPQPSASVHNRNFTKDEIMAMPTIIVVPTSGASQVPSNEQVVKPHSMNPPTSTTSSTAQSLQPLTIDVASNNPPIPLDKAVSNNSMPLLDQQKDNEKEMLVKTLDTKMVSAPRDGGEPTNKNTPQVLPPMRKSSSTPRRTSHVRVLDFATPRRILQEAINENVAEEGAPVEMVISRSPSLHTLADTAIAEHTLANDDKETHKTADSTANSSGSSKENDRLETLPPKKNNWDADLRTHAITNKKEDIPKSCIQPRCRPKSKTNKSKLSLADKKSKEKSADENENKCKNVKSKRKSVEVVEESVIAVDDTSNVPVKPTINIIAGQDWSMQDTDKNQNNKSNSSDPTDTPEMERLLTNNGIGIKLNISDLLETPYKQVLYDIQMETPRFLGPDLPGEPLSDIKICNIPTPRFLNTPKVQATPSSYSSRPTDYSSGGSYYKPDDQDFIPVDLEYPVPKSTESEISETKNNDEALSDKDSTSNSRAISGRPVRKCAKNVSYYNSPIINNKTKEMDDKIDNMSPSKDTVSMSSSTETKVQKSIGHKLVKDSKTEKVSGSKSGKERKVKKESGSKSVRDKKIDKESGSKSVKASNVEKELGSKSVKDCVIEQESQSKSVVDSKVQKESVSVSVEGDKFEKELEAKPVKEKTKRNSKSKKYRSPLKREPPRTNFMKIKPRRVTPVKESAKGRERPRKNSEGQSRKRTMSKENTIEAAPVVIRAPTKSRRKSATPRKSDRYVTHFNSSEDSETRLVAMTVQDSDTEQVQLHWSDEGSQDTKRNEPQKNASTNETEDIAKIKDYIASELQNAKLNDCSSSLNNLHVDLIKRGFDVETAKIIERDLLDSPADINENNTTVLPPVTSNKDDSQLERTLESDTSNNLRIQEEGEEDCEEFELTESECNEDSANYITCNHDDLKEIPRALATTLKDKFSMEVCIDDGVTVRLRATPITTLIDQDPHDLTEYNEKETELAISSISNIDKLYTPMKDPDIRAQVYNIFDSTLTSLDTPIKVCSPRRKECDTTAPHVTLEVESVEDKDIPEDKRRKRLHSDESNDSVSSNKRSKTEAPYFSLNSANIQNIDIETVLSKLHGP